MDVIYKHWKDKTPKSIINGDMDDQKLKVKKSLFQI